MGDFRILAITPERPRADEAERISLMLGHGAVWRVHLRHPGATEAEIENVIKEIDPCLRDRITLHDFPRLASSYKLGFHLNTRVPTANGLEIPVLSRSCHNINEVLAAGNVDFVTLSPIYDSISKAGYRSAFSLEDRTLAAALCEREVIALGGVRPEFFGQLADAGFAGAALLGFFDTESLSQLKDRLDLTSSYLKSIR